RRGLPRPPRPDQRRARVGGSRVRAALLLSDAVGMHCILYISSDYHQKWERTITLPFRHIKATMRTGKTSKVSTCSHKKTCEIFWQAVSDNLHIRPFYVAKSQTKLVSPIRNFARISRVWWQGITAKPAKNYDKAQ